MTPKRITDSFPPLIFFISFSTYLFTALPSTYWRDTPEFQTIGFLLDIAHPAGSPLYAMMAKLFTFIPIGSIAFKTTLVSAFFGAAVATLIYLILSVLLQQISTEDTAFDSSDGIRWIAFFATLVFSFSNALWENSNSTEVYAFQNFFTALFILILLKTDLFSKQSGPQNAGVFQLFFTLSFLYGLSLGAHAILILYLPLLLLLVYFVWLRPFSQDIFKTYALLFFFFLLGFSVYLYLPIRSSRNPFYNWGDPETLSNFLIHITDRKDASYHFSLPEPLLPQFLFYLKLLMENFSFLGILVAGIGLIYLVIKKEIKLLAMFALFYFPPFIFFVRYWRWNSAFIPTFLVVTLLLGIGIRFICKQCLMWQKRYAFNPNYIKVIWGLLGIQLCFLIWGHFKDNADENYWFTRDIYRTILNGVPHNSIIFMVNTGFGLSYLQQIEGFRPDVTLLSVVDFMQPRVFTKVEQAKYPHVVVPTTTREKLGPSFIKANINDHPIYWEPSFKYNKLVLDQLVPDGFFFRISTSPVTLDVETKQRSLNKFREQITRNTEFHDSEEKTFYWNILNGRGTYYFDQKNFKLALGYFEMARMLIPDDMWSLKMLGATHIQLGELEEAEKFYLEAMSVNKQDHEVYRDLGLLYFYKGKPEEAEKLLKKASDMDPTDFLTTFYFGVMEEEKGDIKKALFYFEKVLEGNPDFEDAKDKVNSLQQRMNS